MSDGTPADTSAAAPPWLSVVIPTYNGARFLPACLASIEAQRLDGVECLAIDDGSTDATLEILESFGGRIPLRTIEHPRTGNWVANTNVALSQARGTFACFLHQDDLWRPGRVARIEQLVDRHPGVGLFMSPSLFVDPGGSVVGRWRCPLPTAPAVTPSKLLFERLLIQNFVAIPAPVFRRDLVVELGGLDDSLWYTADWDLWLKLARRTEAVYTPEFLTAFRLHPESQTVRFSDDQDGFREQMTKVIDRHLDQCSPEATRKTVARAARFSIQLNVALASSLHGQRVRKRHTLASFLGLGPSAWRRYLRDSRIHERASARYRIRLGRQ